MDILETLNGPELVVRFQKFFGVIPKDHHSNGFHSEKQANGHAKIIQNGVSNGHCTNLSNGHADHNGVGNGVNDLRMRNGKLDHNRNGSVIANGTHHPVEVEKMKEKVKDKFKTDEYEITNKFFYYLFHFGANLGNEIFYITFYPFWIWNIDGFVGRRVCIFWALFMYLGQATKDILKIPRPASPPVMRMEKLYALEYGMPSTHAMVGAGFPFTILFLTWQRYVYPVEYGFVLATLWTLLVCCSRLYLGMHSVLELVIGVLYVFALMPAFFLSMESIDAFILQNPLSPYVCFIIGLLLCIIYPAGDAWSPARMDTYIIMAVGTGVSIGFYLNFALGWIYPAPGSAPYEIIYPDGHILGLMALRTVIGVVVLVITRAICKKDVLAGLLYVSSLMPLYLLSMDTIDEFIITNPYSPLFCIGLPLVMCVFYPKLDRWSTARGDTTVIVSCASGVCVGAHFANRFGFMHRAQVLPPYPMGEFSTTLVLLYFIRVLIGVAILVLTRAIMKSLSLKVAGYITKVDTNVKDNLQQLRIELPYKFATYFSIAVVTVIVVPLVFSMLGIQRDSYFHEL